MVRFLVQNKNTDRPTILHRKVHKKKLVSSNNPLLFSLPHETGGLERIANKPESYIKH